MSLVLSPMVLAKYEDEFHHLNPFIILALIEDDQLHPLCPASALCHFLEVTSQVSWDYLYVWSSSLALCSKRQVVQVASGVTDTADPGKDPVSRAIWEVGASLSYLRHSSEDHKVRMG